MSNTSLSLADLLKALLVTCIWGLNFSLIKYCLNYFDPYTLTGLRFLLCVLPLIFLLPKPDVPMKWVVGYGLLFGIGTWGMVNLGVQLGISPGIASVVLQSSALFTFLFGVLLFKERLTLGKVLGLLVSASGLVMIARLTDGSITLAGMLLVLLGALFWGISNSLIKASKPRNQLSFLTWSCLFSPIPLFVMGYVYSGGQPVAEFADLSELAFVVFLLLASSYIATIYCYVVWNSLIARYDMAHVAPLSLAVPVFGLLSSAYFFSEPVGAAKLVAGAVVLVGLLFSLRGDYLLARFKGSKK